MVLGCASVPNDGHSLFCFLGMRYHVTILEKEGVYS